MHLSDIRYTILDNFDRFQETNQVWFKENEQYKLKADSFIIDWNNEVKKLVIKTLQDCLRSGGIIIGVFA
ncbi:hypothetical protein JOC77_000812 [Peribacillus deserti]|uniref:Uncharacterized protein n=1 Tax=Peribacillus deserti TaxID=673318 RepID=A0ABS2QE89_9BACI|nr:hypothetical protein [Peribacillus deserti]